jgi:hypothetical protein
MKMKNWVATGIFGLLTMGFAIERAQAADERVVCGTNEANEIWCTTYNAMEQGKWERLPGAATQVLVRSGHIWAVNAKGHLYYAADYRNPHWIELRGDAKEISEGNGLLCVVNTKDTIYCADKGITTPNPDWKKAPDRAALKFISVN